MAVEMKRNGIKLEVHAGIKASAIGDWIEVIEIWTLMTLSDSSIHKQ